MLCPTISGGDNLSCNAKMMITSEQKAMKPGIIKGRMAAANALGDDGIDSLVSF